VKSSTEARAACQRGLGTQRPERRVHVQRNHRKYTVFSYLFLFPSWLHMRDVYELKIILNAQWSRRSNLSQKVYSKKILCCKMLKTNFPLCFEPFERWEWARS